ncbi:EamA family transporter [Alphaproteobacteria bacterium GH1-50]|uniref:EamA family transporter n=1 Tax=Kangsaoukella pontilimi TaxID=2691042 RepID=A0A7C9MC57_9RHOB|nr:DMT family transporter [Kangsaoukella pontilimi]MXQ09173.1 EamA family transporter [Kangsaoukella pontilimi]
MQRERVAILVTLIAAAAWGLFWLPIRAFEEAGLGAGWTTLAIFLTPALLLVPLATWRRMRGLPAGAGQVLPGVLVGGAVVLYSESLLWTDVARALILFYVTPVWGTALEILLLGRRLTPARALALILGLLGLVIILGGRTGVPLPQNAGDVMALVAGMLWAVGSMRVRMTPSLSAFEGVFSFFLYGSLAALVIVFLPFQPDAAAPSGADMLQLAPWLIVAALGFVIPVVWGLIWGAKEIDAGRLGILLQLEAIVGIGSAAILTDEPFGLIEATGALLVIGAGVVDVLGDRRKTVL